MTTTASFATGRIIRRWSLIKTVAKSLRAAMPEYSIQESVAHAADAVGEHLQ